MVTSPEPPEYAELHCVSNFSFLRGASHPEELVRRAAELGYRALALTDECSFAGVVRAHQEAKRCGLHLIIGTELKPVDGPRVILLAPDRASYGHLAALITRARRAAGKGSYLLHWNELADVADLTGCIALLPPDEALDAMRAGQMKKRFPERCWLAVERLFEAGEEERLQRHRLLAERCGLPLVAAGDVHMHVRGRRALQDTLTAIRIGRTVADAGFALHESGERHLRPRERLAHIYEPALLAETLRIAALCRFSLDELRYEYPAEIIPPGETPSSYLRRLTLTGMQRRWPGGAPEAVKEIVEKELRLIAELGYEHFFITVHDIVRHAREQDILCQGRGSAANSAVCYCLGITEVDPARMSLLFERFISRERNEPPDIDVDFEHERREEIIRYIYEKYGRDRAALAATVIRYRPRSALRDVGKALGMDAQRLDRLAKSLVWTDGIPEDRLREQGFDPDNPAVHRWMVLTRDLIGFPRHLSQHVGGFIISRGPLSELVPIENAAMPERTVIQWDKDDLDALGLLKVDVLALGMLSAIRRALALINDYHGTSMTMADIPPEDGETYRMIQRADTMGVFQIESRAQMSMLPRLRPKNFYDLVIEVALVRPGPIQGQMVHPYLRRRQGLEPVDYPSPEVQSVLERTLGVPIFQEQVMQIAMVAAGFSAGEADLLRRSMASWHRKGGLEPFQQRLREGMRERGYDEHFIERICRQIEGFAEYGFPESHSASFALLAYVSSWLKCHHPAAFIAALLNSQPMGFYAPAQLVQDARRHGVDVRPVDVCHSAWDCTLEPSGPGRMKGAPALRLGLRMVKGWSETACERLLEARRQAPFANVQDLAQRANLAPHELSCLAAAGALSTLAGHRHRALWQALGARAQNDLLRQTTLFEADPLMRPPTEGENIVADYAMLGLTLGRHPLALLRTRLRHLGYRDSAALRQTPHGHAARVAGLVTARQRPGTTEVTFLTLEDEHGSINVIVQRRLAERRRPAVNGGHLLGISGRIERVDGVEHMIATKIEDHSDLLGSLVTRSRDFH
jgi:error-prone DNA polymerase